MSVGTGIGSFMEGLAMGVKMRRDQERRDTTLLNTPQDEAQAGMAPIGGGMSGGASAGSSGGSGGAPMRSSDPVATDLAPHQRAFLNAISDGESGGKYNVRYTPGGGAEFSDLSRHPGIMERTADGKMSSAAGRYQFTKSTWNGLGGGDFSPENQDRRAWQLAQSDYKMRTGGDLDSDLQKGGLTPQIMKALQPTWTSFGANGSKHIDAYNNSLGRYSSSGQPQNAPSPAPESKSILQADTPSRKPSGMIGFMQQAFS